MSSRPIEIALRVGWNGFVGRIWQFCRPMP